MDASLKTALRTVLACLLAAAALPACTIGSYDDAVDAFNNNAPPPPPPPPPPGAAFGPNFSEIQVNVFSPTCATAGCHSGANPPAGLNLEPANSYMMLVGVDSTQAMGTQRVNPFNPDDSYLIQKLEGPGATGVQMPSGGVPLAQAEIDVIRQWITQGAEDDRAVANTPIKITSVVPVPNDTLDTPPTQITVGFDREPDPATVNDMTFILEDGNNVAIAANLISVPAANTRSAIFDLGATVLADDTYTVRLLGDGGSVIMDMDGNALDGENLGIPSGDDVAGGDWASLFTVATPVVIGPTLDEIQAAIFDVKCASCHGGAMPRGNLDLSTADISHAELVNVLNDDGTATLVVPGDPANSYLVQKIDPALIGDMPPGAPLSAPEINAIRQWIMDGAAR